MPSAIIPSPTSPLALAGRAANVKAARQVFADHLLTKAKNTIRRKRSDVALFEKFLASQHLPVSHLFTSPEAWKSITWGLIKQFVYWQVQQGYAIPSANARLSTIKVFSRLAFQAGYLDEKEYLLIEAVRGYSRKEGKRIDKERLAHKFPIRHSSKKSEPTIYTDEAAERMKNQADTPKGRRNSLLMCLLIDHGLRVGEVAALTRGSFDLKARTMTFYREKIDITQTHQLTDDTYRAAVAYLTKDAPQAGILWRRARKMKDELGKQLREAGATRSILEWVKEIGLKEGLDLSPHDNRHYGATYEARHGTPVDRLMDWGGWASPAMPMRYINKEKIANSGTAKIKSK